MTRSQPAWVCTDDQNRKNKNKYKSEILYNVAPSPFWGKVGKGENKKLSDANDTKLARIGTDGWMAIITLFYFLD